MASLSRSRSLLASASAWSRVNANTAPIRHGHYRRFHASSLAASTAGALPLEGYRVLDMTRVLAGVSFPPTTCPGHHADFLPQAVLHANSR